MSVGDTFRGIQNGLNSTILVFLTKFSLIPIFFFGGGGGGGGQTPVSPRAYPIVFAGGL